MRVRLNSIYASARGNFDAGAVVDLPQAEAYALIEAGHAAQIPEPGEMPVEEAVAPPREKAVGRGAKKAGRPAPSPIGNGRDGKGGDAA